MRKINPFDYKKIYNVKLVFFNYWRFFFLNNLFMSACENSSANNKFFRLISYISTRNLSKLSHQLYYRLLISQLNSGVINTCRQIV